MFFDALVVMFVALVAGIGAWKGFAWQLGAILAPIAGLATAWPAPGGLAAPPARRARPLARVRDPLRARDPRRLPRRNVDAADAGAGAARGVGPPSRLPAG